MKSKSLKHWYYELELGFIMKFFPFKSDTIPKVSLKPLKLLVARLADYSSIESNLQQNVNLNMNVFNSDVVNTTLILERIVKACKKDIVAIEERHMFELKKVVTYSFFTNEEGNLVDIDNYVTRIKKALEYLIDYFEKNRDTEGTNAYANCKTIYMHLGTIHAFIGDLQHVFLSKQVK